MKPNNKTFLRHAWKIGRTLWLGIAAAFLIWHNTQPVHAADCVDCTSAVVNGQTVPACKGVSGNGHTLCVFLGGECKPEGDCSAQIE